MFVYMSILAAYTGLLIMLFAASLQVCRSVLILIVCFNICLCPALALARRFVYITACFLIKVRQSVLFDKQFLRPRVSPQVFMTFKNLLCLGSRIQGSS